MRNAQADASGNPRALRLKHNKMSDMTLAEKMAFMGLDQVAANEGAIEGLPGRREGQANGNANGNARASRGRGLAESATNVDHNLLQHMYPVKDQGSCGSCWAFTSNSVLEGTIAAKTGKAPVRLSEQHLVDCSGPYGNGGCGGGWMTYAWGYQRDYGAYTNDEYPYTASNGTCSTTGKAQYFAPGDFDKWTRITDDLVTMKAVLREQPLSIAINASDPDFSQYGSGVYTGANCDGSTLNHAVAVVGYTDSTDGNIVDPDGDGSGGGDGGDTTPSGPSYLVNKWWYYDQSGGRRLQDAAGNDGYWKI